MRHSGISRRNHTTRPARERDPLPWRYCFLTLVCGLILVVGFFWAARQHFSAMDYSIKNAKLRQMKENLTSEQRQLSLNKEISISPNEIKKAALKIGLSSLASSNIQVYEPKAQNTVEIARNTPADAPKPALTAKLNDGLIAALAKKPVDAPEVEARQIKFTKDGSTR